jgi:hypothetical protein
MTTTKTVSVRHGAPIHYSYDPPVDWEVTARITHRGESFVMGPARLDGPRASEGTDLLTRWLEGEIARFRGPGEPWRVEHTCHLERWERSRSDKWGAVLVGVNGDGEDVELAVVVFETKDQAR